MKNNKTIVTASTMSNLVGMYAAVWIEDSLKYQVYICGKANENLYIVQAINALTGEPNVAKLVSIDQMKDWDFLPTMDIATMYFSDYEKKKERRYTLHL